MGAIYERELYSRAFLYGVSICPETSQFHSQKAIATIWTIKNRGLYDLGVGKGYIWGLGGGEGLYMIGAIYEVWTWKD